VELRNDQIDPEEHQQSGDADQDVPKRDGRRTGISLVELILAAETRRIPVASKTVKITDVTMETTVTRPRAAQSTRIRPRSLVASSS
jgi:hypothetical protein